MSSDLDFRLKKAVAERDKLAADVQRIAGRKEAAENTLRGIREEIQSKNLDPDTLDETIKVLETAYAEAVEKFERDVNAAREAVSPYMKE